MTEPSETFDYIVVGGGSAGSVVAARLSEDANHTVLLLEAGPADTKRELHIPAAFSKLFRSELDWNYDTEPQENLGYRQIYWPRGKVLGGSSSINAMMWVRGFAEDYDSGASTAGDGWSWAALAPYFRRVENVRDANGKDADSAGTMTISVQRSPRSSTAVFLKAAAEIGLDVIPANGDIGEGVTQTMVSQRNGTRFSTADGYLKPARNRPNLTVRTGAQATRVVFEMTRAVGVEYVVGGSKRTARASREIILAGGSINTPQLLMLSGIGARDELEKVGIPVIVDSPEVGKNLRDHLIAALIIDAEKDTLFAAEKAAQLVNYISRRRGMLSSNVAEAYGLVKSDPALDEPDMELLFAPVAFVDQGLSTHPTHGLTIGTILLQPHSTGTISLVSADPFVKPRIDPRYLSDPDGHDRRSLMAALEICADIVDSEAMGAISRRTFIKPDNSDDLSREQRHRLSIDEYSHTLYHPVGTARMGLDARSVVDENLRVRGVQGLRVADASVMPNIIRGHTNAPSIVIGEKAADLIKASNRTGAVASAG